jgi:hypothetical protein
MAQKKAEAEVEAEAETDAEAEAEAETEAEAIPLLFLPQPIIMHLIINNPLKKQNYFGIKLPNNLKFTYFLIFQLILDLYNF